MSFARASLIFHESESQKQQAENQDEQARLNADLAEWKAQVLWTTPVPTSSSEKSETGLDTMPKSVEPVPLGKVSYGELDDAIKLFTSVPSKHDDSSDDDSDDEQGAYVCCFHESGEKHIITPKTIPKTVSEDDSVTTLDYDDDFITENEDFRFE